MATHNKFELFLLPRFFPLIFFHYGARRFAPIEFPKFTWNSGLGCYMGSMSAR